MSCIPPHSIFRICFAPFRSFTALWLLLKLGNSICTQILTQVAQAYFASSHFHSLSVSTQTFNYHFGPIQVTRCQKFLCSPCGHWLTFGFSCTKPFAYTFSMHNTESSLSGHHSRCSFSWPPSHGTRGTSVNSCAFLRLAIRLRDSRFSSRLGFFLPQAPLPSINKFKRFRYSCN